MGALGDASQDGEHAAVHFPGISLAGNREAARKAHLFRDHLIGLPAFFMVPVKQLQEAGLGSGGPLGA